MVICAFSTNDFTITFNLFYLYFTPFNLIILMRYHLLPVISLCLKSHSFCIIFLHSYLFFLNFFNLFGYHFDSIYISLCVLFLKSVKAGLTYYNLLYLCSLVLLLRDKSSNVIYTIISLTINLNSITFLTLYSYRNCS